ncbi:hypothetical protein ACH4YO_40085, partial [Streptomyces noursei]|uniref:hypothetical protein n=1 Tax=Streptomyces noursei TaxID=1971 RepID=UPI0033C5C51E
SAPIFAGAIRPFGFLAVPTLSDPFSFPGRFPKGATGFEFGSDFRRRGSPFGVVTTLAAFPDGS